MRTTIQEDRAMTATAVKTYSVGDRVIRFAEYLNMERFDIHATSVAAAIEDPMHAGGSDA
jgi:hypothetical protein